MGIEIISLLMLAAFVLLIIVLGMPIAFATGLIAVVFCALFADLTAWRSSRSGLTLRQLPTYCCRLPMFLMMANILDKSGVAHDLYEALKIWAGGFQAVWRS